MQPGGILAPWLGWLFGIEVGSGMALQFALCSFIVVLICFGSYAIPALRDVERRLPEYDSVT